MDAERLDALRERRGRILPLALRHEVIALLAHVEALQAERDRLAYQCEGYHDQVIASGTVNSRLTRERVEARAALAVAERKVEMVTTVSDALERENARRRAALEEIDALITQHTHHVREDNLQRIARAALAGRAEEAT